MKSKDPDKPDYKLTDEQVKKVEELKEEKKFEQLRAKFIENARYN